MANQEQETIISCSCLEMKMKIKMKKCRIPIASSLGSWVLGVFSWTAPRAHYFGVKDLNSQDLKWEVKILGLHRVFFFSQLAHCTRDRLCLYTSKYKTGGEHELNTFCGNRAFLTS